MIPLTIILACILLYTEFRLTAWNMNTSLNGLGSVNEVMRGVAMSPVQYRVLIPWIVGDRGKLFYVAVKGLGIWFALYSFSLFCNSINTNPLAGVLFLSAILPMMFLYDYADCFYEFGFFALAFALSINGGQGLLWLAPITLLAALNRETAIFIPIGYFLLTGDYIGTAILLGIFAVGYMIPRIYYGKKPRYCNFSQISQNIKDFKDGPQWHAGTIKFTLFGIKLSVEHLFLAILLSWFIGSGFISFTGAIGPLYWMMCFFIAVLIVPSIWWEVRVFMPVLLVIIPITLQILGR